MYGIVNKAMEDLIVENYGTSQWELIKEKGSVDVEYFLSNEPYDDDITYRLVGAASEVLGLSAREILIEFGKYWVLKTGRLKYGGLLEAGGSNLKEFFHNLPAFHNRVMLIYPNLTPPSFKISHEEEHSVHVHYYSQRNGLQDFVQGLLEGLGAMYDTPVQVELIQSRNDGHDHEIFHVNW